MNVVRQIRAYNFGRDAERLQLKYRAMRRSGFAFLRGTCHLFYEQLPRGGIFKSAPLAWICGDLHLENFGSYKGDNRLVYFDLNDFDEAVLAPVSWELVRLLTSLRIGAETLAIDRAELRRLCDAFLDAYSAALVLGKPYWVERETARGLVRALLDTLRDRQRARFLDSRTTLKGKRRILRVDGRKALAASPAQRARVMEFMAAFARQQADPGFYRALDVARRIAGTGSLGVDRYVILVHGKGSPDRNYLLDLKQALPSALVPQLAVRQPRWETQAHRVVALQQRVQAVPMAFLYPVMVGGHAYVLRGLQPSEDRIALDGSRQSAAEMEQLVATLGRLAAWGQLRSSGRQGSANADQLIEFGRRGRWRRKLLDASEECAAQVRADWQTFCAAYDDGAFGG
jgi:uncharacterized protein (DUF2252 family)